MNHDSKVFYIELAGYTFDVCISHLTSITESSIHFYNPKNLEESVYLSIVENGVNITLYTVMGKIKEEEELSNQEITQLRDQFALIAQQKRESEEEEDIKEPEMD